MTGTVYDILTNIQRGGSNGYAQRMLHKVPEAESVKNRVEFILERCKDKVVLDIGSAGTDGQCTVFKKIEEVAKEAWGIDSEPAGHANIRQENLDSVPFSLRVADNTAQGNWWCDKFIELIVMGEFLEHIPNPGILLEELRGSFPAAQLLITVPNAFSAQAIKQMEKGTEAVNEDHVCWYSWHTLKRLVEKSGYQVDDFFWYNGPPKFAEGLIFICSAAADSG